jgi:hypothetical protein
MNRKKMRSENTMSFIGAISKGQEKKSLSSAMPDKLASLGGAYSFAL